MILNGNDIKKLIKEENIVENGKEEYVSSGSIDVSMSNKILRIKKRHKAIELKNSNAVEDMYEQIEIKDRYKLKPNEVILVVLNEKLNLPKDIVAHIRPRTSLSRLGIVLTTQHINAGYRGVLNIALYNLSPNTYIIEPEMRIGQIVFEKLTDGITDDLVYGNSRNSNYQDESGNSGSKIYCDYIGKVFRHFKGNYYYIEAISTDSETKEDLIVYRPLYDRNDSMLWSRPAKMFFEEIDTNRKENITGQKHRFELVENLSYDYIKNNKES